MTAIKLPEMPEPKGGTSCVRRCKDATFLYTADQLRADRLAVAQAVREACAREIDCGCLNREAARAARGTAQRWAACGQPNCAAREADNIRAIQIEGETR
jgi:hypothetical protein